MASSRIFVRGLPPSTSEEDFKKHFSQASPITDTKLIAPRRIGYVGYKTPEEAAKAVKRMNKSFIRMSRLRVELAQSASRESAGNHHGGQRKEKLKQGPSEVVGEASISPLKRKRENGKEFAKQEKKSRHPQPQASFEQRNGPDEAKSSKERPNAQDLNVDPKSQSRHTASPIEGAPAESNSSASGGSAPGHIETKYAPVNQLTGAIRKVEMSRNQASDSDWMRSRTSRLLDLVDDQDKIMEDDKKVSKESKTILRSHVDAVDHDSDDAGSDKESQASGAANERARSSGSGPDPALVSAEIEQSAHEAQAGHEAIRKSGRLFLRNLPYSVTENDLELLFKDFGIPQEVHIPRDYKSGEPKGIGFVQYEDGEKAVGAFEALDRTIFQGRLLHLLPAERKRESKVDDIAISQLPLKKQKQIQKKSEAMLSTFSWNSLFMNADAVNSSTAARMGIPKSQLFDPTSSDAAVKQAQAETHVIQEAKKYFQDNGVDLEAFSKRDRDGHAVLVKNFKYNTSVDDLRQLFAQHGDVRRILMPPSATIAIVELANKVQARAAFGALAYRKHKDSVLFLERASRDLLKSETSIDQAPTGVKDPKLAADDFTQDQAENHQVDTSTLYVRNISFSTSDQRFKETFSRLDGLVSAVIKKKPDPKIEGNFLSMGFGFLEFRSANQAKAAFLAMNGHNLDGHELVIRASNKGLDAAAERRKDDIADKKKQRKTKIIVKNLPFEASKRDVRNLFKSYGQLRAVRVPKKFDNSRKGFAFAEFKNPREAENVMDALRSTHLLGRRLVLEYAAGEDENPEEELQKMQQRVERQSDNVALQRMSRNQRVKVNIGNSNEMEEE